MPFARWWTRSLLARVGGLLAAAVAILAAVSVWQDAGAPAGVPALVATLAFLALAVAWLRQSRRLRRSEEALREQNRRLDAAIDNIAQALCLFDAAERLVLCNDRYLRMYGLEGVARPGTTLSELLHHRARHGTFAADPDRFRARLLAGLAKGERVRSMIETDDGRTISVISHPLAGGGWVATHEDISELRRAEKELEVQNDRFAAAISNISQGLIMFDAAERLVLCNERYSEIYGLDPLPAGTSLSDLLDRRRANGTFPGDPDAFRRRRMAAIAAGEIERRTLETSDGRTISIISRPLPDRSWVATHEDITERRRAEEDLAGAQEFLDRVIENVPAAIIVKDPRTRRYMLVNRAAEALLGYPRAHIIGKSAADLYPPEQAAWITAREEEMLASECGVLADEQPLFTARNEVRIVSARRLVISGPDRQPQYLLSVVEDITERKQAEARIAHMAHHDALTGLPNRARFQGCLTEALGQADRAAALAVICLDLDHFKSVNDTLGHSFGDGLLRAVAGRLRDVVPERDMVARLGGDEFAIIQTGVRHPAETAALVQRVGAAIKEPFDLAGHQVDIDVSIGISMAPDDACEPDALLKNADLALYGAKGGGRGTYRFFEPEMDARMKARHQLDSDLRKALAAGELELHFQPLVALDDQASIGFEALLRWHHPERGMIPPAQFVPVAEETGLIVPLGEWVLRQACAAAAGWPEHLILAVNLSPMQFRRNLLAAVTSALAASGLAPGRLELEITEAVLLNDDHATISVLHQLRALGVRVVMDDFGTGYSSLSYLRKFPFDKIKIDRSFVNDLKDPNSVAIVQAIVELAGSLNMTTTAEGIETEEQLARLRAVGCLEGQGYLFGRPAPEAEALRLAGKRYLRAASAA